MLSYKAPISGMWYMILMYHTSIMSNANIYSNMNSSSTVFTFKVNKAKSKAISTKT